ncbi:agmatinase [Anaeromicrobium sediminis]|uniref:Agmatinase n=1 Tax=Anaeromicrobium sediminis TaxID=1478221 RepID=A0A267MJJ4_9FIRM|nr:agmatinase [Anaeromicrobium sediminis]PAB59088.1 agmatinase [Anaeromicrobium sediminis]
MTTVNEMIKDHRIWAGLNKPDLSPDESDVLIFGIPFDGSVSFRSGAKDAPKALREITYTISPTTEDLKSFADLKVLDLGDCCGENRNEVFEKAEEFTYQAVKSNKFFTMIGGDHSTTIPVHKGIDRALDEPFGIIHFDAHFDLCDDQGGDKLSHGSTERRALELKNVTNTDNLFFVGIRSIESDELDFFHNNKINVLTSKEVHHKGVEKSLEIIKNKMKNFNKIYITLDIDCLDPAYAGGTGTPQFGGLTSRELLDLLYGLFELPIIGFDVVEVAPKLDPSLTSLFAARKIITECWGHYYRKNNR